MTPPDPRLLGYMRQTIANASGRFKFRNVPASEYYVTGQVTWEVPGLCTQGGAIWKLISVQEQRLNSSK